MIFLLKVLVKLPPGEHQQVKLGYKGSHGVIMVRGEDAKKINQVSICTKIYIFLF